MSEDQAPYGKKKKKRERFNVSKMTSTPYNKPETLKMDPNRNWALVELYRWQHGFLPGEKGKPNLKLDLPTAVKAMGEAFDKPQSEWPAPFNVGVVLKFLGNLLHEKGVR